MTAQGVVRPSCALTNRTTAGFVLVGGRSSRMRRDKALLAWHSRPLVEYVAHQVAAAAGNVALVGNPKRYGDLGLDCFPDLRPGLGPLAGIETALETKRGELNLIVACDMPGLDTAWLVTLLETAQTSEVPCVATRETTGAIHPLCAVYRNSCLPKVRLALDARSLKLLDLLEDLPTITIETGKTISNINTPEEWTAWQNGGSASAGERIEGDGH